jgi:hypothetical protein
MVRGIDQQNIFLSDADEARQLAASIEAERFEGSPDRGAGDDQKRWEPNSFCS